MLDDRKSAILRAVVEQYIETAQPVGSGVVADAAEVGVSSATVRSEMTTLEREGYLVQPHTSAGRIPTEKGYRFFVDSMTGPVELGTAQLRQVRSFFAHAHGELETMLKDTGRLLSELTESTAMVVGATAEHARIRSVQVVPLSSRMLLVVTVLSTGVVLKDVFESLVDVTDEEAASSSRELGAQLTGRSTADLGALTPTGATPADDVTAAAFAVVCSTVETAGPRVFVEGASLIAGAFDASETLGSVLGLLEQQLTVVSMLRDVIDRGMSIAIGTETGVIPLSECSVVVAPFMVGGDHAGTIGVLGPTRMNYPETLAAVGVVSQRLSRLLTQGD